MNCGSSGFNWFLVSLFLASQPSTFDGGLGVCQQPVYENEVSQFWIWGKSAFVLFYTNLSFQGGGKRGTRSIQLFNHPTRIWSTVKYNLQPLVSTVQACNTIQYHTIPSDTMQYHPYHPIHCVWIDGMKEEDEYVDKWRTQMGRMKSFVTTV